MISEVDIRDWEKVDIAAARESLQQLDVGYDVTVDGYRAAYVNTIEYFINQVELIQKKQVKQIPALFKERQPCHDFGRCNCTKDCRLN